MLNPPDFLLVAFSAELARRLNSQPYNEARVAVADLFSRSPLMTELAYYLYAHRQLSCKDLIDSQGQSIDEILPSYFARIRLEHMTPTTSEIAKLATAWANDPAIVAWARTVRLDGPFGLGSLFRRMDPDKWSTTEFVPLGDSDRVHDLVATCDHIFRSANRATISPDDVKATTPDEWVVVHLMTESSVPVLPGHASEALAAIRALFPTHIVDNVGGLTSIVERIASMANTYELYAKHDTNAEPITTAGQLYARAHDWLVADIESDIAAMKPGARLRQPQAKDARTQILQTQAYEFRLRPITNHDEFIANCRALHVRASHVSLTDLGVLRDAIYSLDVLDATGVYKPLAQVRVGESAMTSPYAVASCRSGDIKIEGLFGWSIESPVVHQVIKAFGGKELSSATPPDPTLRVDAL